MHIFTEIDFFELQNYFTEYQMNVYIIVEDIFMHHFWPFCWLKSPRRTNMIFINYFGKY
jgi:hypothetical protein